MMLNKYIVAKDMTTMRQSKHNYFNYATMRRNYDDNIQVDMCYLAWRES